MSPRIILKIRADISIGKMLVKHKDSRALKLVKLNPGLKFDSVCIGFVFKSVGC
jgi:hypothetical protein